MSISDASAENSDLPLIFDPVTGKFNKPLESEGVASDFDNYDDYDAVDVSEADYESDGFGARLESEVEADAEVEAEADAEVEAEADADAEPELEVDPVSDVLTNPDLLGRMVDREATARSADRSVMEAINGQAQNIIGHRMSGAGMLASYCASKIAGFRERRNAAAFQHNLSELDRVVKEITPWGFNPSSAESLEEAREHFKTNGRGDIDRLEAAYKTVLDSGSKVANGYRSSSADATSKLFQEEVLKKTAHFLKDNEKLLKCMRSRKSEDKMLFDDFKDGLGGLLDVAKMAFAKLALLLGAVGAAKDLRGAQRVQESGAVMPLPRAAPPANMPRMR